MTVSVKSTENDKSRVERIEHAVQAWISPENSDLKEAVERTVREGLFPREDVYYQLQALTRAVSVHHLSNWYASVRKRLPNETLDRRNPREVLTVHAGNIPLAGFQDVVSVALSGSIYHGKYSKRDPWILPTLVNYLESEGLLSVETAHTELQASYSQLSDIFFSGGTDSWEALSSDLSGRGVQMDRVRTLKRTAQFSVAILDKAHPATMKELVQAIALYDGRGCRSVAMVLTELPLEEIKCSLGDYFEAFWLQHPQRTRRTEKLRVRAAYNRAMGRPFTWLDSILVEESDDRPDETGIVHWCRTDRTRFPKILESIGDRLQSIYVPVSDIEVAGFESRTELLDASQTPPINWRPDGIDPLEWLMQSN